MTLKPASCKCLTYDTGVLNSHLLGPGVLPSGCGSPSKKVPSKLPKRISEAVIHGMAALNISCPSFVGKASVGYVVPIMISPTAVMEINSWAVAVNENDNSNESNTVFIDNHRGIMVKRNCSDRF